MQKNFVQSVLQIFKITAFVVLFVILCISCSKPIQISKNLSNDFHSTSNNSTLNTASKIITYPSDIIPGLINWKVTLPVDKDGNDSSKEIDVKNRNKNPLEVADSNIINFAFPPYFEAINNEIVFRGHCAGATTIGSKYPRCELRQRVGGGDNLWSVNNYQYLQAELRVTKTPVEKPEVCMVQIHGPHNEPLRVQYHAKEGLKIIWNEKNTVRISDVVSYSLEQLLRVTVTVEKGTITCTINNKDTDESFTKTWVSSDLTGFFKIGCYTQSSIFLSQLKKGKKDEPKEAYGEVRVSKIDLTETY
jgi:hypothetical protein